MQKRISALFQADLQSLPVSVCELIRDLCRGRPTLVEKMSFLQGNLAKKSELNQDSFTSLLLDDDQKPKEKKKAAVARPAQRDAVVKSSKSSTDQKIVIRIKFAQVAFSSTMNWTSEISASDLFEVLQVTRLTEILVDYGKYQVTLCESMCCGS